MIEVEVFDWFSLFRPSSERHFAMDAAA